MFSRSAAMLCALLVSAGPLCAQSDDQSAITGDRPVKGWTIIAGTTLHDAGKDGGRIKTTSLQIDEISGFVNEKAAKDVADKISKEDNTIIVNCFVVFLN